MLKIWRHRLVGLVFVAAGAWAPALAAETPAGIVMATTGSSDPPLSPMTEIPADKPIKLDATAELTFLDYARCKLVTVVGGTLNLTATDYSTDGRIKSEEDGPCPQAYSIAPSKAGTGAATTAGLIMRSAAGPPRWPVNAQFLLTGQHAERFHTATVSTEDRPDSLSVSFTIVGGKAVAAPGTLPLLANRRYRLRLISADPAPPIDLVFVGTAPSQPAPIIIFRVD
jgi:hypothetical protein